MSKLIMQSDIHINGTCKQYATIKLNVPKKMRKPPFFCPYFSVHKPLYSKHFRKYIVHLYANTPAMPGAQAILAYQPGRPDDNHCLVEIRFLLDPFELEWAKKQKNYDVKIVVPYKPTDFSTCYNDILFIDEDYKLKNWDCVEGIKYDIIDKEGNPICPDICELYNWRAK